MSGDRGDGVSEMVVKRLQAQGRMADVCCYGMIQAEWRGGMSRRYGRRRDMGTR